MSTLYDADVVAWAEQQALLLRTGQLSLIDIEHIAEEIEDVGKSELHKLESRLVVLWSHLLKWQYQAERRGSSWQLTIAEQRRAVERHLRRVPSLKRMLVDADWLAEVWMDAMLAAVAETHLTDFPRQRPWPVEQTLDAGFWPE